jgi:hypothetical protein
MAKDKAPKPQDQDIKPAFSQENIEPEITPIPQDIAPNGVAYPQPDPRIGDVRRY